ncbi:hypothetical protein [Paenibacillus cremeus]|uniref:Uncharacterized protein n=1 Tax=Paenibacillus cremeus TaxID=2163881 RepID=A0A559KCP7_9BACL|nr:hypothetical protein [Paenibacillus cremeus]TVY09869.1 hypothetical protein FPZ49_10885 [Paenibacillus cremeus]
MELNETTKPVKPEFTLTMSLEDAIDLWRIVNAAYDSGNQNADKFVDVLYDFAANSNRYTEYLSK